MPQPILRTENLSYSYDNVTMALSGVTLDIPKGKKTVFLGPNGAGKSTLFLHLNGVLKPDSGTVFYEGKKISYDSSSLAELRKNIALVFQNPDDQIFSATVEEDVAFGPLNLGLNREEVGRRVDEALSWIGLENSREKPTQQLSFGERKRVALAGALAMKPNVLVMDEPTAGLDYEMVHELLELSDELNNRGLTVIISTHDVETAYEWADEVRALNAGRLVFSGGSDEFFEQAELLHDLGLMPPLAFLLNQQFHLRTGSPEKPYPRNIVELSQKFFSTTNQSVGKITLVCVDEEDIQQMAPRDDLLSVSHMHSGVFGSTARRIARKRQLDVHYRFHAVEFGLLAASQGSDFTIYTDSSLCGLVESKVKELEMHTGLHIDVTKASKK
ncbi:MAG: ATP-binding cassette domain-containing protein [Candidatus Methanomethylicaceae archaeon]